jgi:hypothetical protein
VRSRELRLAVSRSYLRLIPVLLLLSGLAACGGSGSATSGYPLPTEPITITQQNAHQVAGAAFDALTGVTPLPAGVTVSLYTSGPNAISITQKVAWLVQQATEKLANLGTTPPTVLDLNCPVSGTITLNVTSATSEIVTYNNCSNVAGETINGTVTLSNLETATQYQSDNVFNLTFTTASPANTTTAKGDMQFIEDFASVVKTISGDNMWMVNTDTSVGNFEIQTYTIATFGADGPATLVYDYGSSVIGGIANFHQDGTHPFINTGGIFPSSGIATITGTNSTVIKLTVLGDENAVGNQLQFEFSTDGGITYAAPTYDTWANISNLL